MTSIACQLSTIRLGGVKCPDDLEFLADHCEDLLINMGISFRLDEEWAPWANKSYLTESDYANSEIAANVKAIEDTCALVVFFAETDGGECIGYWVGPKPRPINECPVVYYDTEGQFNLCGGRFVESLFHLVYDDDCLEELRSKCAEGGIPLDFESLDDIVIPPSVITPNLFHEQRYDEYRRVG